MEDEERRLLRETLEIEKENNRLLRRMHRDAVIGRIITLLVWAVMIGAPIVLYYYFLSPYVAQIQETYRGLEESAKGAQSLKDELPEWAREWFDTMSASRATTTSE